ncbi:hypothetical protein [Yersinia pseudotuberculosis]|uniref:hypothetical protein n=1 Tax=Yersinia pseudotuberculosis TaxID=633 RepID=UPI0004F65495|nr:hypothetical protein [Yersinia pseudotuberculosis]AIN13005.1 hypothetical protein DJ40_1329 [Yersinia pseudotuberculosis]
MTTWRAALVASMSIAFIFLLLNRNHLANRVDKAEAELLTEQATNVALGSIIDAYQLNDVANRAATARQLENERKLRNDSDERLKRFKTASAVDSCADSRLSNDLLVILRE